MTSTPLPEFPRSTTPEVQEYWNRAAAGVLALPFCPDCQQAVWYPRAHCPQCGRPDVEWVDAVGTGRIYSYTVVARGLGEFKDSRNYVVAYVELTEGPRVLTNIVDWEPGDLFVGRAVEVVFNHAASETPVPRFRPVVAGGDAAHHG